MAFLLNSGNCTNCQSETINFSDCTGLYANNATGFGSPNLAIADITSAVLSIIYPNGTTTQSFDITAAVIANAEGSYEVSYDASDFGLTAFEDGWYTTTYTVSGTILGVPVTYVSVKKSFYYCALACCVQKAAVVAAMEEKACCDDCSKVKLYKKMKTALEILKDALCCGNEDAVNAQWARLKLMCAGSDCGCH